LEIGVSIMMTVTVARALPCGLAKPFTTLFSASLFSSVVVALSLVTGAARAAPSAGEVNIYSYREPKLMAPVLKAFTEQTGIATKMIFAGSGLIERMTAEGRNSPADVLLTNEFGLLIEAVDAGVTQAIVSPELEAAIPAALRDPANHWFGLTKRARIVYAAKERVAQPSITYEELADPKWKGKICMRSGQHTYNISMIASMIAHLGEDKAEAWLTGVKNNLARKPAGGDREAVRDVAAGQCDLAIGNTYYMAAMQNNPDQKPWADAVRIMFPNTQDRGTHVNISGAAVGAHAPNKANAVRLIAFLASPEAQALYASANGEYPVREGVALSEQVASWGTPKPDALPLATLAKLRRKASELVDKVRFDQGPAS
jgi:iron(III) transport system substrate-binding protein